MANETYLGDGLYASFDGYQIKLRAPRDGGDHEVFLDESVFMALLRFMRQPSTYETPRWMRTLGGIDQKGVS